MGHLDKDGADLTLVFGEWGEGTSAQNRFAIALKHFQQEDGKPALMVVDATNNRVVNGSLASSGLLREEVIGTPLANQVFAITDAIYKQDHRFF